MALNAFTARTLTDAINQIQRPLPFLRQLLFSDERQILTETADMEVLTNATTLAKFIQNGREARVVSKRGRKIATVRIPSIREKKPFTAMDAMDRPGGNLYVTDQSVLQKAINDSVAAELSDFKDRFMRTEEYLCASALSGALTITTDDGDLSIDFSVPSGHKPTLTSTAVWGGAAADIPTNIDTWSLLVSRGCGTAPDTLILGTTAAALFLADSKVRTELNNNNFSVGSIDLTVPGRQLIARNYRGLEVYRYDAQYTNDSGTATNFIPANVAVLASRASRHLRFFYGPINDLKAGFSPTKFFSKQYETEDPSQRWLLVASSPLPFIGHAQSIVYATVA